jgi:butyrate kinase
MSLILAINPGSTSTKIAVYDDLTQIFVKSIQHSAEEISKFDKISDQYHFRKDAIETTLKENGFSVSKMSVIVGRGGILKPVRSGVYEVNDAMVKDLLEAKRGEHASNLGGLIAKNLSEDAEPGCKAFIADPVVVDELIPIARVAGHPLFERRSIFHALNQKAIAKMHAATQNKKYDEMNLIVAHLGGGVSVGAHCKGSIIDVNNALDGEGPFSPERSGTLPAHDVAKLCFSGEYTYPQVKKMLIGEGGVVAHLGTNAFYEVERRVNEGDEKAKLISDAFAYNIAKTIGSMAAVLKGKADAILLTGGIANNKGLMNNIKEYIEFIAPVFIYPGEDEMGALAKNGYNVLKGIEEPKVY